MEVLAGEICRQLQIHGQIEQEVFYPASGRISELSYLIEAALEDHAGFTATIEEIEGLEAGSARLGALVLELRDQVDRHFLDEEETFFPEIAKSMPQRLEAMGAELDELRQRLTSIESI